MTLEHKLKNLDEILSILTMDERNAVMDLVFGLCGDFEHKAFLKGMHVGFRLTAEMAQEL